MGEDRELKERKAKEKQEKENKQKEEKERIRLLKEQKEKEEQARKEQLNAQKSKNLEEKNNLILKAQNDSENALGIQNYDSTEAPSMIQKEKQFDKSHKEISDDLKSPNLIEKFEYEPTKEVVSGSDSYPIAEEYRAKNPFESESDMIENCYENK